jgi:hypothetical protein
MHAGTYTGVFHYTYLGDERLGVIERAIVTVNGRDTEIRMDLEDHEKSRADMTAKSSDGTTYNGSYKYRDGSEDGTASLNAYQLIGRKEYLLFGKWRTGPDEGMWSFELEEVSASSSS